MEQEVTLIEMLDMRESRAARQRELLEQYRVPLISFSMNIAGPVKNSPVIRRGFQEGMFRLKEALRGARMEILHQEQVDCKTGCEAMLAVSGSGEAVKHLCVELEDEDQLGRLFDLDVLERSKSWSRAQLELPPRRCLICGAEGKGCASRRLHSVEELQEKTKHILRDYFRQKDSEHLASMAVRALLYEVSTTPKPGLVDCANSGSHRDMDLFTFLDSTAALMGYLRRAAEIGQSTTAMPPEETFARLRTAGLRGEREMFAATGEVNTHKGAIYSLGTVCAAAGRLWTPECPFASVEAVLSECGRMAYQQVEADFAAVPETGGTAGEKFYRLYGLRGIRGELADGLPAVQETGLPTLKWAMAQNLPVQEAGVYVLLAIMARGTDTNLLSRGGIDGAEWAAQQAKELFQSGELPSVEQIKWLDQEMIKRNLSPGGCADLLAITYFLHFCEEVFGVYRI